MSLHNANIAFIRARWHAEIVDQALVGFRARAAELGHPDSGLRVVDVPGAFEMPLMAKRLAATGEVDAVVAAALVVDGGIYRHDFVASAVVDGLMRVQLDTDVPVFSVSLTPHHFHDGEYHRNQFHAHFVDKGREAANAVDAQLAALAAL
ncbi:MAG: 6,7-dimethyl-8-ribityllumazine synthase [Pseudomonadota bacterium]